MHVVVQSVSPVLAVAKCSAHTHVARKLVVRCGGEDRGCRTACNTVDQLVVVVVVVPSAIFESAR